MYFFEKKFSRAEDCAESEVIRNPYSSISLIQTVTICQLHENRIVRNSNDFSLHKEFSPSADRVRILVHSLAGQVLHPLFS